MEFQTFETLFYLAGGAVALALFGYITYLIMRAADDIHHIRRILENKH